MFAISPDDWVVFPIKDDPFNNLLVSNYNWLNHRYFQVLGNKDDISNAAHEDTGDIKITVLSNLCSLH